MGQRLERGQKVLIEGYVGDEIGEDSHIFYLGEPPHHAQVLLKDKDIKPASNNGNVDVSKLRVMRPKDRDFGL